MAANCSLLNNLSLTINIFKTKDKERLKMNRLFPNNYKFSIVKDFNKGIIHDLNNIFMTIAMNVDIIKRTIDSEFNLSNNLDNILLATQKAKEFVTQMNDTNYNYQGKLKTVNLYALLRDGANIIHSLLPATVDFQIYSENKTYFIYADSDQINRVIINLCINAGHAIKACNGTVKIFLENISIKRTSKKGLSPGQYVKLSISDNGCGMTPEVKKQIFKPYFTTKQSSNGNGIGLFVVDEIVKSHGDKITVQSEPGKGTIFNIYFPEIKFKENDLDSEE